MSGSVGRYARHTKQVAKNKTSTQEVVLCAPDMAGAPSGETEATYVIYGISPMYQFAGNANNSICTETKIPSNRVPGTPITLEAEIFMAGIGGLGVMPIIRYGIYGKGQQPTPLTTEVWQYLPTVPPAAPNTTTTAPVIVTAVEIDGRQDPVDIQIVFTRQALHPFDVDGNVMYLVKIIMRYIGYE